MSTTLTFDIEAVMDPELGDYTPKPGRDAFPPPAFWQVVCIGALLTDARGRVLSLDIIEGDSERTQLEFFTHLVETTSPRLISFNGRGYDLPVIGARCRRHGLSFPYRTSKQVSYRYSTQGHYDVADWLGDFGAGRRAPLDVEARLIGMPGKGEVEGGDVAAMVAAGRINEVRAYCLADVVQTHAVALRADLEGGLRRERYLEEMSELVRAIDGDKRLAWVSRTMNRARLLLREGGTSTAGSGLAAAAE